MNRATSSGSMCGRAAGNGVTRAAVLVLPAASQGLLGFASAFVFAISLGRPSGGIPKLLIQFSIPVSILSLPADMTLALFSKSTESKTSSSSEQRAEKQTKITRKKKILRHIAAYEKDCFTAKTNTATNGRQGVVSQGFLDNMKSYKEPCHTWALAHCSSSAVFHKEQQPVIVFVWSSKIFWPKLISFTQYLFASSIAHNSSIHNRPLAKVHIFFHTEDLST